MPPKLTVHIVDDDAALRASLAFLLETQGYDAQLHMSGEAFLDSPWVCSGSCVLTDVCMPGIDGLELMRLMSDQRPAPPVIIMTAHADVPLAVQALRAGALDVLEKPFDKTRLFEALALALGPGVTDTARAGQERIASLSGRERDVLHGIAAGKSNKTTALELGISPRTVEVYRAKLMAKAGVHTMAELMRFAVAAGF